MNLAALKTDKARFWQRRRGEQVARLALRGASSWRATRRAGFTMIEIAIAIGSAVSNLNSRGMDFLTNYVDGITITFGTNTPAAFTNLDFVTPPSGMSPGNMILGLLSTPAYVVPNILNLYTPGYIVGTNFVRAWVRGLNGSAMTQGGSNSIVAFRYVMDVRITPFVSLPTNALSDPTWTTRVAELQYLGQNLYEANLTFHWPVLANGQPGPNSQVFRTTIASHMLSYNPSGRAYYYFQPHVYSVASLQ